MLGVKQFKKSGHPLGTASFISMGEGGGDFPAWNARGLELNSGINVELTVGEDRQFQGAV